MRRLNSRDVCVVMTFLLLASAARGQCPDGSPPPCRAAATVAVAPKRVNPPLDDRTWIVVPFDNLNRSPDADWLRGASVNLLYLGMSRWNDIRVIDDERVADLMREVPEATATSLSLNTGIAVARKAGAGRLVMGDVLKLGTRTTVTAKVFDVKSGQRVRSVREEATSPDSVMPLYGKLAQKVLNVAPPQGVDVGSVGTTRVDAYQEYAQGLQALNQFDLAGGKKHLERALQLDSSFALAHYKLSILGGWVSPNDAGNRAHIEAAARLSSGLPPRERALINAQVAFARRDYPKACEGFSALVHNDSTDTDAWYGLGDCKFHDTALEAVNGDTTRVWWRADLNASVRAFEHALSLDPSYHLAYQHMVDAYSTQFRSGSYCVATRCVQFLAVLRPSGDSLIETPLQIPRDTALLREAMGEYTRVGGRRQAMEHAYQVALKWLDANPSENRARFTLATTLLWLGRVAASDSVLALARFTDSSSASITAAVARLETAVKLGRGAEALHLYDSLRTNRTPVGQGPAGPMTLGMVIGVVGPLFGHLAEYDSIVGLQMRASGVLPSRERLAKELLRSMIGLDRDSVLFYERKTFDDYAPRGAVMATRSVLPSLAFGLRLPRASWPAIDTTFADVRVRPALALMRHDTTALRRAARQLDSVSSVLIAGLVPDTGIAILAGEAYLALGDSVKALGMARRWLDSSVTFTAFAFGQTAAAQSQTLYPYAILMRADLAARLGARDEARLWYKRLLDLWTTADAELRPVMERVRKSYAAVGGV